MVLGAMVVVLALLGAFLLVRHQRRADPTNVALATRIAALRPFAQAAPGEEAKVEGVVSLLDGASVQGPVVEAPGVWIEAEVRDDPDPDSSAKVLKSVRIAVPFGVAGVRVRAPEQAMGWPLTRLVTQRDWPWAAHVSAAARVRAFFAGHGFDIDPHCVPGRKIVFLERCLKPGVEVLVIGKKVRSTTAAPTAYRDAEPPFELAASTFYESEADVARAAKPVPWGLGHTILFGIAFAAVGSILGTIAYVATELVS